MSALPVPENVRAVLGRLPRWFPGAVGWSVKLANYGPRWVPGKLLCVPFECLRLMARLAAEAPGVWGYPPWKRSETGSVLRCRNTSGGLAEPLLDVGQGVKTQLKDITRHEKLGAKRAGAEVCSSARKLKKFPKE